MILLNQVVHSSKRHERERPRFIDEEEKQATKIAPHSGASKICFSSGPFFDGTIFSLHFIKSMDKRRAQKIRSQ